MQNNGKQLIYSEEAREKLKAGIDKLANAVKVTLGAKGRNVIFAHDYNGMPMITSDGVAIARQINLSDPFEDMGAQLIKEVAIKTNDVAGDGTTTATLLAQALVTEGLKNVAAGANPLEIRKGIDKAVDKVVDKIKSMARPVESSEDIAQIATVSSDDPKLGKMIAEIIDEIGKEGVLAVEDSKGIGLEKEIVKGMQFGNGWLSQYFITEPSTMRSIIEDPYILITDKKITNSQELVPALNLLAKANIRNVVIIAQSTQQEPLSTLVYNNNIQKVMSILAVNAPGYGETQKDLLADIAAITGGVVITEDIGLKLETMTLDDFGRARRVIATRENTLIVDGLGEKEVIEKRVELIRSQLTGAIEDYDKDKFQDRIAKLTSGVGIIKVGGTTESETKELKYRVEDAIEATKAAIEEGIVAGGGVCLLNCANAIASTADDEGVGMEIVRRSLSYPIKQIAENGGVNGDVVIEKLKNFPSIDGVETVNKDHLRLKIKHWGYNVLTDTYGDMFEMGIIDPAKVVRCALQNAASVAALVLTTETIIVPEPQKTHEE